MAIVRFLVNEEHRGKECGRAQSQAGDMTCVGVKVEA